MARFRLYFFETARGEKVIDNRFELIQSREKAAWSSIASGLAILEDVGATYGGNRFNRLRHITGAELWELRAQGRPAYRVLFAEVPGVSAYVVLAVARKDDMSSTRLKAQFIAEALENFEKWLEEEPR